MISEESWDTEDTVTKYISKYIEIIILNCNNISKYYCFNTVLSNKWSRRDVFQKHKFWKEKLKAYKYE